MNIKELISREQLLKRLDELALELDKEYEGKELVVLSVMRGSVFFFCRINFKNEDKDAM